MNKKIVANTIVCLMLVTILTACFQVSAKNEKQDVEVSNEASIKVILKFADSLKACSCRVSCDGIGGWTSLKNGFQSYTFNQLNSGVHNIRFHSSPPYTARMKTTYLSEGESKTVILNVRDMNSRDIIVNNFLEKYPVLQNILECVLKL